MDLSLQVDWPVSERSFPARSQLAPSGARAMSSGNVRWIFDDCRVRWMVHRWSAYGSGTAYAGFLVCRWAGSQSNPTAAAAVTGAFALLLIGAAVSLHKRRLLGWIHRRNKGETIIETQPELAP